MEKKLEKKEEKMEKKWELPENDGEVKFTKEQLKQKYFEMVSNYSKEKAGKRVEYLETWIAGRLARAERACGKYEDCGPMDIASEEVEPYQAEVELLKWFVKNPTKFPKMVDSVERVVRFQMEKKQAVEEKKALVAKFPSLVGKTISWVSSKTKEKKSGVVLSQRIKWDEAVYKVDTKDGWTWKVPHNMIKKVR